MIRALLLATFALSVSADSRAQSQSLDCGLGGKQKMDLISSFSTKVTTNSTIEITIGGNPEIAGAVEGSAIKALEWYFIIPNGLSPVGNPIISSVAPQGTVVTGSGSLGAVSVSYAGNLITMKAPGTLNDHSSFIPPAFTMSFQVTGGSGSKVDIYSRADPAYKLNAFVNVNCKADGVVVPWTDITVA
jgi:hypothetical protein